MELCPRISCWTARVALLVMVVVLLMHHDNQQNVASASPVSFNGFEDYSEGDRVNGDQPSLYELLLQRELLADKLDSEGRGHLVVRKSDRTPSLRLRFGRRADPDVPRVSASQHD